jgi:hypothetical protein
VSHKQYSQTPLRRRLEVDDFRIEVVIDVPDIEPNIPEDIAA